MDKPIGFWTNTFARLGLRLRKKPETVRQLKHRAMRLEQLQDRRMLATDLAVAAFASDGQDWTVAYDVSNQAATAFDIGVYRSSDGVTADTLIQTRRITDSADLAVGTGHTIAIDPNFTDVEQDYYLVVKLDNANENSESSETNNQAAFAGGFFLNGSELHVHGTDGADSLDLDLEGTIDVTMGALSQSYNPAAVSTIHARMHGGNDSITTSTRIAASMWAFGGDGNDTIHGTSYDDRIYGGDGDDTLYGGDDDDDGYGGDGGADVIYGGAGNDTIYGQGEGDILYGDAGNDTIYGDDGADTIHGGPGNDTLFGGGGNDTLYGDAGADALDGGPGVDILHGGDGFDDPEILDDGETGYAEIGSWSDDAAGGGFNGNQRLGSAGSGSKKASWTFENLPAADYEVHVTWDDPDDYGGASDAPFSVFDGSALEGIFDLNQRVSPSGSTVADASWRQVGTTFTITSGTLKVELTDDADGTVRADAVRIVQAGGSGNDIPDVDAGADGSINEGGTFTSSGSFTDSDADTWTATVNYGDGSGTQSLTLNQDKTFSLSHTYADNGNYTVTVTVTDSADVQGSDTVLVSVANVAPTLTISGASSVDEDTTYSLSLSSSDPGADTIISWQVNWGDGQTYTISGNPSNTTHTYTTPGNYTISATATDEDGSYSANSLGLAVNNVNDPPVASNDAYLTDGVNALIVGVALGVLANDTDPDAGDTLTAHLVTGPSEGTLTLNTDGCFTYTPNSGFTGPDTFIYEVRDPQNASSQAVVTIALNQPPVAEAGGTYSIEETLSLLSDQARYS